MNTSLALRTLPSLSDAELLYQTLRIAKLEQDYSLQLIEHLLEVDLRKLFAGLGYDSLLKYVVKELGYSESTAYERIRAMRLVRVVPEARSKLQSGALTLSSAAQLESFRKQENLPQVETTKLLERASHKSLREVECLLLSQSENPIPKEKTRQLTAELQDVRIILTPELQALIRRYEELQGKAPVSEILKTVLEVHLKKHGPLLKKSVPKAAATPGAEMTSAVSAKPCVRSSETSALASRYITAAAKREIWARSQGQCEWRHPGNQERCTSRFRLQFDHYPRPFAQGGSSTLENLRHVCSAHNARFAVETYGVSAVRSIISNRSSS